MLFFFMFCGYVYKYLQNTKPNFYLLSLLGLKNEFTADQRKNLKFVRAIDFEKYNQLENPTLATSELEPNFRKRRNGV